MSAFVSNCAIIGANAIEVQTEAVFGGKDVRRQLYGILENRVALLRIEDASGNLLANEYQYSTHQIGPDPPTRTEEQWELLLCSSDRASVLEALTWIGGRHYEGEQLPDFSLLSQREIAAEKAESVRMAAAVRVRSAVQKRIGELATSDNPWIREAAELAMTQLPKKDLP